MNESTGEVLQLGDTLRMQALSKTLKEIAEHGVDVFYKGSIGTKVVEDIQRRGGILTRDDLIHYRFVTIETPIFTRPSLHYSLGGKEISEYADIDILSTS